MIDLFLIFSIGVVYTVEDILLIAICVPNYEKALCQLLYGC